MRELWSWFAVGGVGAGEMFDSGDGMVAEGFLPKEGFGRLRGVIVVAEIDAVSVAADVEFSTGCTESGVGTEIGSGADSGVGEDVGAVVGGDAGRGAAGRISRKAEPAT